MEQVPQELLADRQLAQELLSRQGLALQRLAS